MFGDGGLGHAEAALDLADGLLGRDEKGEDGAAIRLGDDFEGGFHVPYILLTAYTCQGIYKRDFLRWGSLGGMLRVVVPTLFVKSTKMVGQPQWDVGSLVPPFS